MNEKLNSRAFALAAAIISAVIMLLLGILANFGIYLNAAKMMMQWHIFFSLSPIGIIGGMIEAAGISFVFGYAFGWLYNKFI